MAPFYTSTTPVFRGLPIPSIFILFSTSLFGLYAPPLPLGAIWPHSAPPSSPHPSSIISRPSRPFLVRCCGDTTQLPATLHSIPDLIYPTVWSAGHPLQVPVSAVTLPYCTVPSVV